MIYIKAIKNVSQTENRHSYPLNIPSLLHLNTLEFNNDVTFIIGENGIGKSTLIEALAINAGFNPEGGSRNFNFKTHDSHSNLYEDIKLIRSHRRNADGFFLRAESLYNVASEIDNTLDRSQINRNYGGSLHELSHGEGFLSLVKNRLTGNGLYIFDEPESGLSINTQLSLLIAIKELVNKNSQFIITTHSPIILAYPGADIFNFSENGIEQITNEETEHHRLTKYFMNNHQQFIETLGIK